jgi:hypothetical protein
MDTFDKIQEQLELLPNETFIFLASNGLRGSINGDVDKLVTLITIAMCQDKDYELVIKEAVNKFNRISPNIKREIRNNKPANAIQNIKNRF